MPSCWQLMTGSHSIKRIHQLADFVLGDFSENEPRHQESVSYVKIGDEIMLSSMMYR